MRKKLTLTLAAVAAAIAFGPSPGASASCNLHFYEHTGYCSPCLLVADKSQRPTPVFCLL